LARKLKNDTSIIKEIFSNICSIAVEDGVVFNNKNIKVVNIMEDADYKGIRVIITAFLGAAKKQMQIDIGFGDIITPNAKKEIFPAIFDTDKTILNVYPLETVIAEKYETMIKKEILNSRMKDFYDVYILLDAKINNKTLKEAIKNTFDNRKTELPKTPFVFTEEFYNDANKQIQWKAFLKKNKIDNISDKFKDIVIAIKNKLTYK
jgi:predicted nucleotidyltransferase component of viral defense system